MTDPISDLLTRIRNGVAERHEKVEVPASRIKANIVRVLKDEGFIRNFRLVRDEQGFPVIRVYLKYMDGSGHSVIRGIRRVSRPGLRRYAGYGSMPRVLGGAGVAILSTSKGVITSKRARQEKVGGEVLCEVW
jgi:small subunit ribosomal protein S8